MSNKKLTFDGLDFKRMEAAQAEIAECLRGLNSKQVEAALVAMAMARLIRNLLAFYRPSDRAVLATLIGAFIEERKVTIEADPDALVQPASRFLQ